MSVKAIVVVSRYTWLADYIQQGTDLPVYSDFGFDAPDKYYNVAWWMPTEHVASLRAVGQMPRLYSPGTAWQLGMEKYIKRDIVTFHAERIFKRRTELGDGFYKMAEVKHPTFDAKWRTRKQASKDVLNASITDSMLQYTSTRLDLEMEFRCYVLDYEVISIASYLPDMDVPVPDEAREFADKAATTVNEWSCVMDIGYDKVLGWVVVECNPAWSSNPYNRCGRCI